ncbi:protein translocase subunit SecD [Streptomyces sp. ODS28]|uniref:protein translocase subunit SecD n=1 Tax=Streptomyces sp. ODS28 TaxID=3136688 RepID=UPI0031E51CEC
MAAPKKGRRAPGAQGKPWRSLTLIAIVMAALVGGMFVSGTKTPRLGIDLAGGTSITLAAKNQPGKPNAINPTNMATAVSIINQRVNGLGVSEAEVQTQGSDHIVANIPKGTNSKQAEQQVGTTAELAFRPVLTAAPSTSQPQKPGSSPSTGTGSKEKQEKGSSAPQGRAVTDGVKAHPAADPTPKPGEGGKQQPTQPPSQPQQPAAPGVSPKLNKELQQLDCSTKKAKGQAGTKAANAKPEDPVVACDQKLKAKYVLGPTAVQGKHVKSAKATMDPQRGQWIVNMNFDDTGSQQFSNITGKLMKKQQPQNQFAIVMDGSVVSAPSVQSKLSSSAEISGSFTQESAEELANVLSYGALPLTFEKSDVTTVTPALGSDQLHAGLVAGAIGLALVIVYLIAYYRGLSFIAILSLLVSAILTYTIMTLLGPAMGFALNLPAVCGAIVALGITADSFIVYFERIRDEVREGRTLRPAVARAWPRARRTILVSDFVSFLSAAVLFAVTVGKVQGFAFTLGLTTALDVVVVFFFTKPLMTILAGKKFFASGHPWSGLDPKRLGAKPPLRRGRGRPTAGSDPKEA